MMVGNILGLALGAIGGVHDVRLLRFTGSTDNAAGYTVPAYADPVRIVGNVQPLDRKLYQALGLDFAKDYVTLYTSADVQCTGRDRAGDRFTWEGDTYLCESGEHWHMQAGWVAITAVKVPA